MTKYYALRLQQVEHEEGGKPAISVYLDKAAEFELESDALAFAKTDKSIAILCSNGELIEFGDTTIILEE